uniref:Uncharacterized protein n=1 Tax=uncultured marine virus TaxID=186617 RepID=A0A0F7L956_9VIRU|nr:hypothetical protein [uncultured marine virus]
MITSIGNVGKINPSTSNVTRAIKCTTSTEYKEYSKIVCLSNYKSGWAGLG